LKAADLPNGQDVPVKMADVRLEMMEQAREEKPVLYFIGKEKGLVLNVTNANTISDRYGDDTETWHGQPIVLLGTTTEFGGKTVPCIRAKMPRPPANPAPVAPPPQTPIADNSDAVAGDDEIPF
jgi:hypothetical protein